MQQQCRRDGGRAEARPPTFPSAPGSFVSPHPTLGWQLLKLVPTIQRGPGLWALFLNPLVGIPGLWGSWRDFRAGPEGGEGGSLKEEQVRGVPTPGMPSHWALSPLAHGV